MGLRGFGPWLRANFPAAFRPAYTPRSTPFYTSVYIDVNTLMYTNARQCLSGDQVLASMSSTLHSLLSYRCLPTDKLFLAVDGAASLPKLLLQRERRRQNGEKWERDGRFDCRQFTPGCLFMGRIVEELGRITKLMRQAGVLGRSKESIQIVIDPGTRAGEGEFKIIQDILSTVKPDDRIAIVSSDSDLFLYPLMFTSSCDIDVHVPFSDAFDPHCILSLKTLRKLLTDKLGHGNLSDFVILALLSGNDYLPAVPWASLKGTYETYQAYCKTSRYSPFYLASKQRLSKSGLIQFLKFHRDNAAVKQTSEANHGDPQKYLLVLQWMLRMMQSTPDYSNKLADIPVAGAISLDSLIMSGSIPDSSSASSANSSIEYIPGAIGMSLLCPSGTGREYLPRVLADLETPDRIAWWQDAGAIEMLQFYNHQVTAHLSSMSHLEKTAVSPANQIRLEHS